MKSTETTLTNEQMISIEREHEIQKRAKELAVGLPITEDSARAIVTQIGHDPLALATFGSFIEALQEAIEDSVATLAFGSYGSNGADTVRRVISERLEAFEKQTHALLTQLTPAASGQGGRAGASAGAYAATSEPPSQEVENEK